MAGLRNTRASFIGGGPLLVACMQYWQRQGGAIHGVVSDCPDAIAWCARAGIGLLSPAQDQAGWLARAPFEYLFSIVNHAITPASVLALPLRLAINYHDAPLPLYAGFNATSWAILDGKTEHAVTWHTMTATVDGGSILLRRKVEIGDDDTAFTLNAKCSEAAQTSFTELVGMLAAAEAGTASLMPEPQEGAGSFHGRAERPGLGIIDLRQSRAGIRNLIRALDLGPEENWMCRPKLALPGALVIAGQADPASGSGAPGTVLATDSTGVTVAVADGALRFSSLTTPEGRPVSAEASGAAVGLSLLECVIRFEGADLHDATLTRHERFWVSRLASMQAPAVPEMSPASGPPDAGLEMRMLTGSAVSRAAVISALLTYLARTGEKPEVDLAFSKELPAPLQGAYAETVPFRVVVDIEAAFDRLCAEVEAEIGRQAKHGSYARDVVTRYPRLAATSSALSLTVGLCFADPQKVRPEDVLAGASITLIVPPDGRHIAWAYDRNAITDDAIGRLAARVETILSSGLHDGRTQVRHLNMLPESERSLLLAEWQNTAGTFEAGRCIHHFIEAQADRTPDRTAVRFREQSLTYRELDERADAVAAALQARHVGPDRLVAVCLDRSLDLIVGLLGVLKAGGAYVPLDPAYPRDRLRMMLEDARPTVLLTQRDLSRDSFERHTQVMCIEDIPLRQTRQRVTSDVTAEHLAYVIFTSGSTGRPKGVMVRHRSVANLFAGMDQRIPADPGRWLAVTSVSFDISVLELFWTLARGFEVIIHHASDGASLMRQAADRPGPAIAFSLFYFAAGQQDRSDASVYRLLLDGARFADTHDFSAVWTPERHFHAFGGIYPNPAVTTAALATITSRISLRAGSIVLPLHNPLRVAEDWAVIDQLSGGRVGLAFASGWHADDFALMPQNYDRRRDVMLDNINTVTRLWRGEKIEVLNGKGEAIHIGVLPRPVQLEPPIWITAAGSIDTFRLAGQIGANLLTNMLGQDIDDLREKFAEYRKSRREAGHPGEGVISVMLHTFVCDNSQTARDVVRTPFSNYLKTSFDLIKVAPSMFPAFRQPSANAGEAAGFNAARFTDQDMDALVDHAFDRYFTDAGLFGSPDDAMKMIDRLRAIGVNEVACLIDFGVDPDLVIESLPYLDRLRQIANERPQRADLRDECSIAEAIRQYGVTHLQCTPSMMRLIMTDPEGVEALAGLKCILLGGEALPADLAQRLTSIVTQGEIHNMYGPTETTVWSTSAAVRPGLPVTIGRPIINTIVRILDGSGAVTPVGVPGELCIGGEGVTAGYLGEPELTAKRFIEDPYDKRQILYRTGDLARYTAQGDIQFLGRLDYQVKVNGYRIELAEIENVIAQHPLVAQAVVSTFADDGVTRLAAYFLPRASGRHDRNTERVTHWQALWDTAYRQAVAPEARFNTAGWNDSATGMPIPAEQMLEWLDNTESRIRSLAPRRVLEIGCGSGMLLYRLMPHVEHYTGADISLHALETIRSQLTVQEAVRVSLLHRPAHDLSCVPDASCDTVILNSVAQYFPDAAYLADVLKRAGEIVCDGGRIFVGDVRCLEQLPAFHTGIILQRASDDMSRDEILQRIDRRIAQDGELSLSESFFHRLARENPRLSHVTVQLKEARAHNEMTAFRYDVVIHVGGSEAVTSVEPVIVALEGIREALEQDLAAFVVPDLLNARVAAAHAACAALQQDEAVSVRALREICRNVHPDAVDPADLLGRDADYEVELVWARSGDPARFDAIFKRRGANIRVSWSGAGLNPPPVDSLPPTVATEQAEIPAELRAHVRAVLPAYMTPDVFIRLDAMPLTPNGKIDRKALPKVEKPASSATGAGQAPINSVEETIAGVWRALLGRERVGRQDNIFDLGANSLLTVQANQRLSVLLDRKVSLVSMFRYPTIAALASYLESAPETTEKTFEEPAKDPASRRKEAARRRREIRSGGNTETS